MHLHILGICGTFMGGIARLAIEKGHRVTGADENCYPPMSEQLQSLGIDVQQGFNHSPEGGAPDCVVVGNRLVRGMPVIEAMLNSNQTFISGPEWLKQNILQDKWVIAVAGTHGKTTTASMIAWILEANGYNPSFLIGGVAENFSVSARYTDSTFFVVEADEYDTAFFDKRSKFVHYRARTCILNNLEFDHADIFDDLSAIETQFHHLVRTVPSEGLIIRPNNSTALDRVLQRGCWTPIQHFSSNSDKTVDWSVNQLQADGSHFEIFYQAHEQAKTQAETRWQGEVNWSLIGDHNISNALAALAAVKHVGVKPQDAVNALNDFKNVKRRMEVVGLVNGVTLYDDFAHHPTAIRTTIDGLRKKIGQARLIAVVDPRSNTMRMGKHKNQLIDAVKQADQVIFHIPNEYDWQIDLSAAEYIDSYADIEDIINRLVQTAQSGEHILIMSNGAFGGIHQRLLKLLANRKTTT